MWTAPARYLAARWRGVEPGKIRGQSARGVPFIGSAPTTTAANRGLEDRRVKLGCVMPGESPAVFGDALRRLAAAATYLYQDGPRYWYSTQPTVTKLAEDRAEQLKRDPDKVVHELDQRLRRPAHDGRFYPCASAAWIERRRPDDLDARLVVLGVDHAYSREPGSAAETAAKAILETRGGTPRLYRNALVFLAADKTRLQDLDEAVRTYLAWRSILDEKVLLDLSPHQVRQAETQKKAEDAITARLPRRISGCSCRRRRPHRLRSCGRRPACQGRRRWPCGQARSAATSCSSPAWGHALRMEMDRIPLWRGNHVAIKQLVDDFGAISTATSQGRRYCSARSATAAPY